MVFADSLIDLQELMNKINGTSEQYDLKMNTIKTNFMKISKQDIRNCLSDVVQQKVFSNSHNWER